MSASQRAWTQERIEQLIKLWLTPGVSVEAVGNELGVSKQCISQKVSWLRRHGVLLPRKNNATNLDFDRLNAIISDAVKKP